MAVRRETAKSGLGESSESDRDFELHLGPFIEDTKLEMSNKSGRVG